MNTTFKAGLGLLPMLALGATIALGGVPQPCVVVHGLVRDAHGFPYVDNAEVVITRGTNECGRFAIHGLLAGGIDYRIALDLDSGGLRYKPSAVQRGDSMEVKVLAGGAVQPLLSPARVTVGQPGSDVRLDMCVGTDSDGDGLSDEWELELVEQSGGALSGIGDVHPGDDFDKDGLSNRDEFMAGTFAFLSTDVLEVDSIVEAPGGRMQLRFLTGVNMTYRVTATTSLVAGEWLPIPFAVTAEGALQYQDMTGDGAYKTVYVAGTQASLFLRLATR